MLFNPIIYLILAAISWVLGFLSLNETNNWLGMIPSLFFTALFAYCLFRPVADRSGGQNQPEPRFPPQTRSSASSSGISALNSGNQSVSHSNAGFEKLTVNKLRTYSTAPFSPRR